MWKEQNKLINQYVKQSVRDAIKNLFSSNNLKQVEKDADVIAKEFGASNSLFARESSEFAEKLILSFQKNLSLLIQKTWIEESDAELKDQVLYKLAEYCKVVSKNKWTQAYSDFLQIISDAVYLMFGEMTKTNDFSEYAFRIDPEFGLFWYYIKSLPSDSSEMSNEKSRVVILLGMYFLANY